MSACCGPRVVVRVCALVRRLPVGHPPTPSSHPLRPFRYRSRSRANSVRTDSGRAATPQPVALGILGLGTGRERSGSSPFSPGTDIPLCVTGSHASSLAEPKPVEHSPLARRVTSHGSQAIAIPQKGTPVGPRPKLSIEEIARRIQFLADQRNACGPNSIRVGGMMRRYDPSERRNSKDPKTTRSDSSGHKPKGTGRSLKRIDEIPPGTTAFHEARLSGASAGSVSSRGSHHSHSDIGDTPLPKRRDPEELDATLMFDE